jgi:flavin-binding protein dodecin
LVEKLLDLIGSSDKGWPAAVENAVSKAGESLRNIHDAEILSLKAKISNGKITEYLSTVRLTFKIE